MRYKSEKLAKPTFLENLFIKLAPFVTKKGRTKMDRLNKLAGTHSFRGTDAKFSLLTLAFLEVYPVDGFDPTSNSMNGEKIKDGNPHAKNAFVVAGSSYIPLLSSFFAVPTFLPNVESVNATRLVKQPGTLLLIMLKNFIGWNSPRSVLTKSIALPFILLWNVIKWAPKLVWNLVKLGTQFFPHVVEMLSLKGISALIDFIKNPRQHNVVLKVLAGFGVGLLMPFYYAGKIGALVGRALSSPADSIKSGWESGQQLLGSGFAGKILGGLLGVLSLATTITLYGLFFPIAVNALVVYAPSAISTLVSATVSFLTQSSFVSTVSAGIMKLFGPIVLPLAKTVAQTASLTVPRTLTSLGTAVGASFASASLLEKIVVIIAGKMWNNPNNDECEVKAVRSTNKDIVDILEAEASPAVKKKIRALHNSRDILDKNERTDEARLWKMQKKKESGIKIITSAPVVQSPITSNGKAEQTLINSPFTESIIAKTLD